MRMTRRAFIGTGLACTASLSLPRISHAAPIEMRTIPSSGEAVPVIGLGTWITFNVGNDTALLERSADVLEAFFDDGGGLIDSSPMYGSAHTTLGYSFNRSGLPGTLVAADKVWTRGKAKGIAQVEASASKWGVPRFDVLQVHNLVDWETHLETLFSMKAQGLVRYVGVTTSHGRRHGALERIMARYPIDFVQLTYNIFDREAEDRLLPLAQARGIGVIVNRPFRRGALIERFARQPLPPLASDLGVDTWAQLLLKFIVSHPAVTVVIPATTNVLHMRQNKAAARGPLPDAATRQEIVRYASAM